MKFNFCLFVSLLGLLSPTCLAASDQTGGTPTPKSKIYKQDDAWILDFKKPLKVGAYTFVPHLTPSYHVRSYEIKKGDKVLASEKTEPTGYDQKYGIVLPYATTKPLTKADLKSNRLTNTDPFDWCEAVFGQKIWERDRPAKMPGRLAPGTDVTGDGVPDLIVGFQPPGHGGYSATIYSVGPNFKKELVLEGDDNALFIKDIDGDGKFEILGADSGFNNLYTSYAGSPKPRVIFRIKNNKPALATDLMKSPAPSKHYLDYTANEIKKALKPAEQEVDASSQDDFVSKLESSMTSLVYTGHADMAWKLLDMVWPEKREIGLQGDFTEAKPVSKATFLAKFKERMAKSKYAAGLTALNK